MSDTNIHTIQGGLQSDSNAAEELLAALRPAMDQVAGTLNRARLMGFDIQIGWNVDQFGRYVANATVVKPLARI
jgi:hypothetical protein